MAPAFEKIQQRIKGTRPVDRRRIYCWLDSDRTPYMYPECVSCHRSQHINSCRYPTTLPSFVTMTAIPGFGGTSRPHWIQNGCAFSGRERLRVISKGTAAAYCQPLIPPNPRY